MSPDPLDFIILEQGNDNVRVEQMSIIDSGLSLHIRPR
jgi:hypothetical protein